MERKEAESILQHRFGLSGFYDEQWVAIERILRGERVLLIEKTGFGKSLCFQFPALVFDGVTVIFSPLIALMRDQVKKLKALGIEARCINLSLLPQTGLAKIRPCAVCASYKIGRYLTTFEVDKVTPLVIAKTVGGDI
jgi:superfamily II DNA helicase RecQ